MDNLREGKYRDRSSSGSPSTQSDYSMSAWENFQAGRGTTSPRADSGEPTERQEQEASATLLDERSARSATTAGCSDEPEGIFRNVDGDDMDSDDSDIDDVLAAAANRGDAEGSVEGDRLVLEEFFAAMGGASWVHRNNWLGPLPLDEWHGITTDELGRVTGISLVDDNVTGRFC